MEIILIDDGSPDRCGEICDEYARADSRVKVIHQSNGGVSSARNAGLNRCTGDFIVFIDADDFVAPDYISALIQHDADIVISGANRSVQGYKPVREIKAHYYEMGGLIGPWEKLYKRSSIRDLRFREDIEIGEDILFNLGILKQISGAYFIDYQGYVVRSNPNSLTRRNLGKYDARLDEEYQHWWGEVHRQALLDAGILENSIQSTNADGCSVWIYQKIKNYCYADCPHSRRERFARIKRQLDGNKDLILRAKHPTSPKTYFIIRLCLILQSPMLIFALFRVLIYLNK